jgi:hypothetical protein
VPSCYSRWRSAPLAWREALEDVIHIRVRLEVGRHDPRRRPDDENRGNSEIGNRCVATTEAAFIRENQWYTIAFCV